MNETCIVTVYSVIDGLICTAEGIPGLLTCCPLLNMI